MMAQETETIHATATWVRAGGVQAYLKCVVARGASAGPDTKRIVGADRLDRVRERLLQARAVPGLPLVRLLVVERLDTLPGLLIGMERVRPIHADLNAGRLSHDLSVKVLRSLSARACGGWVHFDICPRNTAITASDTCVLIDPESLYRVEQSAVAVSVPAIKNRAPRPLADECVDAAVRGDLSAELARRKHDAEVIVLAAECSLGLLGENISRQYVDEWCSSSSAPIQIREFWRDALLSLAALDVAEPSQLADTLAALDALASEVSSVASPVRAPTATETAYELSLGQLSGWSELHPLRVALRREQLSAHQLIRYRDHLLTMGRAAPLERQWWEELLLVTLAYERNPALAETVATEALDLFPGDQEFLRKRQLARMWTRGR